MNTKSPFLGGGYYMVDTTVDGMWHVHYQTQWSGLGKVISCGWWCGSSYAIRNWHVSRISGIDHFANILASLVISPSCHAYCCFIAYGQIPAFDTISRVRWRQSHYLTKLLMVVVPSCISQLKFTTGYSGCGYAVSTLCDLINVLQTPVNATDCFDSFLTVSTFSDDSLGSTNVCCDQHVTPFLSVCTW